MVQQILIHQYVWNESEKGTRETPRNRIAKKERKKERKKEGN